MISKRTDNMELSKYERIKIYFLLKIYNNTHNQIDALISLASTKSNGYHI